MRCFIFHDTDRGVILEAIETDDTWRLVQINLRQQPDDPEGEGLRYCVLLEGASMGKVLAAMSARCEGRS